MVRYLIIAAGNQHQVVSTVAKLNCPEAQFFVHIDSKFDVCDELSQLARTHANILLLTNRIDCNWSGFSLVEAMLMLLEARPENWPEADVYQFLSDSCLALFNAEETVSRLTSIGTNIHFWGRLSDNDSSAHLKLSLVKYYWLFDISIFNWRRHKSRGGKYLVRYLEYFSRIFALLFPREIAWEFYKGSQWMSISRADWVKMKNELDGQFVNRFKHTRAPDEIFFQTLYRRSFSGAKKLSGDNNVYANHYIDWSMPSLGPRLLSENDLSKAIDSGCLFMRKVG